MTQKDYTHRGWTAIFMLIIILVGVSFIPPQTIGRVSLRRANIFSDIITFDDSHLKKTTDNSSTDNTLEDAYKDDFTEINIEDIEAQITADTLPPMVDIVYTWRIDHDSTTTTKRVIDNDILVCNPATLIDEFTVSEPSLGELSSEISDSGRMSKLYNSLLDCKKHTRIAVFGDSFIEADILTADLREQLQGRFGGRGAGFTPMSSPLTKYRRTIKTESKNWSSYNIMQRKNAPAHLRNDFYISGWVCQANAGAQTHWEMTESRKNLDSVKIARIFFISRGNSRVEVVINDSICKEFTISAGTPLRQIEIFHPNISSLSFSVLSGEREFVGYGAIFEDYGVTLDNYSVRSNSGQAMFSSNPSINAQFNNLLSYDLVILQYGLNIMESGRFNYNSYSRQIENVVAYVNRCFPTADVLVMGVSDRSVKGESGFVTMDAIPHMLRYQSQAAKNSGASFWSTYNAMNSVGGMEQFVANGWAAKDYTHINYAGGREVAKILFSAIDYRTKQLANARKLKEVATIKHENIVGASLKNEVKKELFSAPPAPSTILEHK